MSTPASAAPSTTPPSTEFAPRAFAAALSPKSITKRSRSEMIGLKLWDSCAIPPVRMRFGFILLLLECKVSVRDSVPSMSHQ